MTELFVHAFVTIRGLHRTMLLRARTERGASMVEYALLVGLIAIVCVVAVGLLGTSISNLFTTANTCVSNASAGSAACS